MSDPVHLTPLEVQDLGSLRALMTACVNVDGGLPAATEPAFVQRAFLSGSGVGSRDAKGSLIAATALGETAQGHVPVSGAVHPSHRRQGIGEALLRWAIREAEGRPVQLRSESVTMEFEDLAARFGFSRVFAEHVMRRAVNPPLVGHVADGLTWRSWATDTVDTFFAAYGESFADRPGFPGWTKQQWIESVAGDEEFRADASLVVFDSHHDPVGFILVEGSWIVQIGVVPTWRRRGVARVLLACAIGSVAASGSESVWLNVNENNPSAISLYEAVGFARCGRRGRFERASSC